MVRPGKEDFEDGGDAEGWDRQDRAEEESREIDRSGSAGLADAARGGRRVSRGLAERLRDSVRGDGEGDLLLEQNDGENGVLQWLRALDLQVLGACRADERLKPLLKLNVSSCMAEDRLIAQLSQHFEASEVGMLARCLCVSLVSIRVGRVSKQGNLLCPTDIRDDGCNERLALVSHNSENSGVVIEEISADGSGRSFVLRLPVDQVSYFWCSEKLKLLGVELLSKMKDLLQRKPSLSQLTGICESRLDSFATYLRAYIHGSANSVEANSTGSSNASVMTANDLPEPDPNSQSSSTTSRSSCFRLNLGQSAKPHACYQGSLSPRLNAFKDSIQRISSALRSVARENVRRRGDSDCSLSAIKSVVAASSSVRVTCEPSTSQSDDDKHKEGSEQHVISHFRLPEMASLISSSLTPFSFSLPPSRVPVLSSSLIAPYYCWCPPCSSSLEYTVRPPNLPSLASESMPQPPLSSLLSTAGSSASFLPSSPPLDLSGLSTMSLPAVFPEPRVRFPLPAPSFATMPISQEIPTFTPFISDPIIHIPIINVCSLGQGYLVSAGPAISSAVPPLLPSLVNPLMPEADSVAEKNARETLRMLMASTPTGPQLMKVLPAVLNDVDENFSHARGMNHGVVVAGSRGLYSGTQDVNAVANSICLMGLPSSPPSGAAGGDGSERNKPRSDEDQSKMLEVSEGSCCKDDEGMPSGSLDCVGGV